MLKVEPLEIKNCLKAEGYLPINNNKVKKMMQADNLPPIVVYRDIEGYYIIIDGLHRFWSAVKQQKKETIPGIVIPESVVKRAIDHGYEMESISAAVYHIIGYNAHCEAAYDDEVDKIEKWLD